jgi:hypothetical protein
LTPHILQIDAMALKCSTAPFVQDIPHLRRLKYYIPRPAAKTALGVRHLKGSMIEKGKSLNPLDSE